MKPQSSLFIIAVIVISGCHRSTQEPTPAPEYEAAVSFNCSSDLSPYYAKASLKGEQLCYSTNDPLYFSFAYIGAAFTTNSDAANYNPANPPTSAGSTIIMGLGGWGKAEKNLIVAPAPVYFSVQTPKFLTTAKEFIDQNLKQDAQLDILVTDPKLRMPGEYPNKFIIELSAQYPTNRGRDVAIFNTLNGVQDPQTAYLKVTEFEPKADGSCDITLTFRCKLYDNDGRYYTEVIDAVMRFNLK